MKIDNDQVITSETGEKRQMWIEHNTDPTIHEFLLQTAFYSVVTGRLLMILLLFNEWCLDKIEPPLRKCENGYLVMLASLHLCCYLVIS